MPARAMWKAELTAGETRLPVKLYAAVEDRNIHFNLLHDHDYVRVKQRLAHRDTGETISYQETRRGVQVDANRVVVLDKEELEQLLPEPSREVAIEAFVPHGVVEHHQYDRPYYLGPDEDDREYFAFAKALAKSQREGIARWTMRNKEYIGLLVENDGYLMLVTLRHASEVIDSSELSPPEGRKLEAKERKLAKQLIEALTDDFEPSEYHDSYRKRVAELIAAKQRGETLEVPEYEEQPEEDDLAASLEASLHSAGR
jgi:DNA end-binding protein Ku